MPFIVSRLALAAADVLVCVPFHRGCGKGSDIQGCAQKQQPQVRQRETAGATGG